MKKINMKNNLKSQQGYLTILVITIIVVLSFVGVILAYMFTNSTTSANNTFQANNAFYIALSGLEKAKRDIIVNGKTCDNAGLVSYSTPQSLFNGQYTVGGVANNTSTAVNAVGGISPSQNTIPLVATSTLSPPLYPSGLIQIDSETIYYPSFNASSNTLQNVTRGVLGTTPAAHGNLASAIQNQCALIATAGSPTIANPDGKRIIQQILNGQPFSFGGYSPVIFGTTNVTMSGNNNTVVNPSVVYNGPHFKGSTIVTKNTVTMTGVNNNTKVLTNQQPCTAIPQCLISSTTQTNINNNPPGDVVQNASNLTPSNLYNLVINQTVLQNLMNLQGTLPITNVPGINISGNSINQTLGGSAGQVEVVISGNLLISGNDNNLIIGANASQVVVIVNGNISISGNNNNLKIGNNQTSQALVMVNNNGSVTVSGNTNSLSIVGNKNSQSVLNVTNGNVNVSGNINSSGSSANSTMFIVNGTSGNGNVTFSGNSGSSNISGLWYAAGNVSISGNNQNIYGGIAAVGNVSMSGNYNSISSLPTGIANPVINSGYLSPPFSLEQFQ